MNNSNNKKKNNSDNKILMTIIISVIIVAITIYLDYINVLKYPNIKVIKFNFDFLNIFVNSIVVITLYIITYFLVDKRNITQNNNKKEIANLLLKKSYISCLEYIDFLKKDEHRKIINKKVSGDEILGSNKIYKNLIAAPFENNDIISSFVQDGTTTKEQYENYLNVKEKFRMYINTIMLFPDKEEAINIYQDEIIQLVSSVIESLNKTEY